MLMMPNQAARPTGGGSTSDVGRCRLACRVFVRLTCGAEPVDDWNPYGFFPNAPCLSNDRPAASVFAIL
jgi:hypothetical protein